MTLLFWLSYALRSLRRGGRRTVFALVCVAVGVAGVVALHIATLTVQNALTSNVRAANGGDLSLTSESAPLSASDLSIFRRLQRQGQISTWTPVYRLHATAVGSSQRLVPFDINVVTAPPYPLGGEPTFVAPTNGRIDRLLTRSGDVLITSVLADELHVGVGSRLTVNSIGGQGLRAVVRGVLAETSFEHAATMTVEHRDAAILSDRAPQYTVVYANVTGSPTSAASMLRAAFPSAAVQTVSEALQSAQLQVHDFQQFMLLVGLLALLIAGIGILNAMQSMLARRKLEIAMLKAIGFRHGTLYGLFGAEALLLGLFGGLAGAAAGAVLSKIISDALARALALQITFLLDAGTLIAGVGLGIGAALVFAVLPIVRAANFRPLEMLREGGTPPAGNRVLTVGLVATVILLFAVLAAITLGDTVLALQFVLGACAICAVLTGAFAIVVGWIGKLGPGGSILSLAVLVLLLGLTVATIVRMPALAALALLATMIWTATVVLPRRRLLPLLIAARSLSRRRARTSVTLVAFLAGVLAMTITLTVALSLQNQILNSLSSSSSTNLVVITTPSSENLARSASRRLPGVKSKSTLAVLTTRPTAINGHPLVSITGAGASTNAQDEADSRGRLLGGITGWNLKAGEMPTGIRIVAGRRLGLQDVHTSNVLVRAPLASWPYNVHLGNRITLNASGSGAVITVKVVGFYTRAQRTRGFGSFFTPPIIADRSVAVTLGGGASQTVIAYSIDSAHLAYDATTLQHSLPGALVIDIGNLTAVVETILNELLNLLGVITALVLGSGLAVVANGVALAMLEQRREIALYKAIGFSPGSVLRFILIENAFIGTLAGSVSVLFTAISLALISHFALQQAVGFDPVLAMTVLLIATGLAVVTAYFTARKPVGIRPLEVLRND